MKKIKNAKLVSLILSLVLLAGAAIGISVSAEDSAATPSLDIISKNLSYGGTISIAFAVEAQNVGDNAVSLLVYDSEPASETADPKYTVTDSLTQTVYGTECLVFFTNGIAAKDMPDVIYVRAAVTVDGVTTYSALERYSVAEYAYDVQYRSDLGEDFVELGEYLIGIGDKIQTVLPHDKDNKPSDFLYASVEEGTLDGKYNSGLYKSGDTVTLKYSGTGTFIGWDVKYIAADGTVTTDFLADNTTVTLDKHLVAAPASAVANFEDGNAAAPNLKLERGTFNVVNDPRNAAEKVLNVISWDSTLQGETVASDNANLWVNNLGEMASDELYATFEGDFYIQNNASHSGWGLQFNFINKNSSAWMYAMYMLGGNSGTTMIMKHYDNTVTVVDHNKVFASNWINIRMDYYVNGADSTITVYVNGQCLAKDVTACQSDATEKNTAPISKVEVRFREANYNFYVDNLSLTTSATAPEAPEFKAQGFDSGERPSNITLKDTATMTAVVTKSPTDDKDNVLKIGQGTDHDVRPNILLDGASGVMSNYYTFATDMYIEPSTKTGTVSEWMFRDSSGYNAFRFGLYVDGGKIYLRQYPNGSGKNTDVVLSGNTWFNIRIDYYVDGENSYVNVYLNGTLVFNANAYYYSATDIRTNIGKLDFQINKGTEGVAIYFDDIVFTNNVGGFVK